MTTEIKIISIPAEVVLSELSSLKNALSEMQQSISQQTKQTAKEPTAEKLLNLKQAAQRLGMSPTLLKTEIEAGRINVKFRKISDQARRLYCREAELNEYIRKNF